MTWTTRSRRWLSSRTAARPIRDGGRWTPGRIGVIAAPALVVVAALAAFGWTSQEHAELAEWKSLLSGMADEQRAALEALIDEKTADAAVFAAFPSVISLVKSPLPDPDAEEHLREVLEVGRAGWASRSLAVLGTDLRPRAFVGEELPAGVSSLLSSRNAASGGTGLVDSGAGTRLVAVSPIRGKRDGEISGWVVVVDDPARFLWNVLARAPAASRTGESLLVGRRGEEIVFISPLRHLPSGERPAETTLRAERLAGRRALEGPDGFGELLDYRGERVLAAVRRIDGPGWGLVVKIDRAEALADLTRARVFAVVVLVSLGLAVVAILRSLWTTERLRAASELQKRDERHRLVLAHVRDAVVWSHPGSGRILEANEAAETLWGYPREELLEKSVLDLRPEADRAEDRRRLGNVPEDGALFRVRQWRKDGSPVSVEVSARSLVLEGEEVIVSVVRDVSESEAALERIRLLNRILRTISVVDQALVEGGDRETILSRTCEAIVATGGFTVAWFAVPDEGGRLVPAASAGRTDGYFEEVAESPVPAEHGPGPAGRAFLEGRTVVVDDWETEPLLAPWREAGRRRGYRSSAACPVRYGDATRGVLSLYASEAGAFVPEAVLLLEELARDVGLALELIGAEERRARAERDLAAGEARYRTLFEGNPAPMWVFDVETLRFLAVNDAAVSLYGYTREEFLERTIRDIRPKEDVAALEGYVLARRSGIRKSGPWRHRKKDGSQILVEVVSHDVPFEGRSARLVLVHDVTERLKAEEKLRAFFDSGMVGAIFADVHGNVFSANDEFLRIVGYTREDLEAGRLRWTDITPPEWLPLDAERIAEAKARGVCTPYEKEYVRKDGARVLVLVGYALVGETRDESVAFVLDLTARREAEARLGATTNLLRAVVDGSPAPILTLDRDGRVTSWNPAAEAVFGYTAEEALGRSLQIVSPEAETDLRSFLRDVLAGHSFEGREVRRMRKDGTPVDVSIAAAPLHDGTGGVSGVAAVLVDISARVRAEEEVRRLNAELEERVERRTEELLAKSKELEGFAYSISHDLRAPLRAIDGFSKMIEEDYAGALDDEGHRLLGVVRDNARRMGRLIDDLLAFSRAGRHDLRRSGVDVAEMVRSILDEVVPGSEREKSDVTVGDLPPVQADPALLRQVFVNLLSNAVKFTATRPRRVIEVSGRREEGSVVYEVADNGVGFDMRYAGKLFGVFQRLHGREFEGTGVGLALVERIVVRHGGTIRASAAPDRGASFTLSFPDERGTR